jgi:GWxTD domain-containing protein
MKKAIFYSFLVVLAACTTNKKIQKAQKEIDKTVAVRPLTVAKPLVVAIKSRYLLKDSSMIRIFMELDIENLNKQRVIQQLNDNFRFNWLLQPDYGIRERLGSGKIDLNDQNVLLKEGKVLLNFEIPRPKNLAKGLLLTEVFQLEDSKKSNNDLVIDFNGTRINDRFGIYIDNLTMPIFRNFINKTDSFQLKSVMNHSRELYLVRYKNDFTAAQSPMATSIRPNIASLTIEETIRVQTNTSIKLSQEGLYQIVEDTNSTSTGFGFMLVDERYPRLTRPETLVKPLIYMSTSQELKAVNENPNSKQALDKFFLAITSGNQMVSKKIIKNYYHRIEEANRLFTSYKEGWKTDKGMVYTVLGPPNKVQRSRDREVWVYAQNTNFSEIIFTFNRKPNQFTENYYELVRYPEYQAYWFPFVEAWRTGNVVD